MIETTKSSSPTTVLDKMQGQKKTSGQSTRRKITRNTKAKIPPKQDFGFPIQDIFPFPLFWWPLSLIARKIKGEKEGINTFS